VIVELSTPGGTVVGSANIAAAIQECSLPLFVYVEDMAASGGVWALTGANHKHVFAHPESILGSIGVLGPTVLEYNTIQAQGGLFGGTIARQITGRVHSVGLGKAYGSPFADGVEKAFGAKMLDDMLQSTYERFLQVVSTARGIEPETLRALGASVMRAPEAKELGLVHAIFTQQELEAHIRAYLGTQNVSFVRVTSERGKWSDLLGAFASQRVSASATPDSLVSVLRTHPALVYYDHDGRLDHG
jgi:serine protease SohB